MFALSEKFDLESSSRRAVYVYRNNEQLNANQDYIFNSNFGFAELTIELEENDLIEPQSVEDLNIIKLLWLSEITVI